MPLTKLEYAKVKRRRPRQCLSDYPGVQKMVTRSLSKQDVKLIPNFFLRYPVFLELTYCDVALFPGMLEGCVCDLRAHR